MKTLKSLSIIFLTIIAMVISSCTQDWNNHYKEKEQIIENENVTIVNAKAVEFLQSEASLSSIFNLLGEVGIIEQISNSTQRHTILVVKDNTPLPDGIDKKYFSRTHVASVSLSPSYIHNGNDGKGMRLKMLNGKNLTIRTEKDEENNTVTYVNGIKVLSITKVNDGFIYELESYIDAPPSLYETILTLDEEYSVFRQMVLGKATRTFDRSASMPVGVDGTGNTVFDSIFTETFPYFAAKGFDLTSEELTATMLLPSNDLITNALNVAKNYLREGNLERQDSILENWFFQSAFFNKIYEPSDFEARVNDASNPDLTSVFSKQWRTTVQQIDYDSRVVMSNGVYYKTTALKLPTNVLIYRLKDHFKWYEFMTAEEKQHFFKETNITYTETKAGVTLWSGWPSAGFPYIDNRTLYFKLDDVGKETKEWKLEFTAVKCTDNGDGTYKMEEFGIPPGEYDLCLGFEEYKSIPVGDERRPGDRYVYFNDELVATITDADLNTTKFHYDRNGQGYPEFYDSGHKFPTDPTGQKVANYDRDGGKVAVIQVTGEGLQPVKFTFHTPVAGSESKLAFHHWCLRPTKNCY